jgi:hypothetical protein
VRQVSLDLGEELLGVALLYEAAGALANHAGMGSR